LRKAAACSFLKCAGWQVRLQYATALQLLQGLRGLVVVVAGLLQWVHALGAMMMLVREEEKLL
jgi:hypothetical protein